MPDELLSRLDPIAALLAFLLVALGAWHARRITAVEASREKEHQERLSDLRTIQPILEKVAVAMQADADATRQHTAGLDHLRQMLVDELRQRSRA